MMLRLVFSGLVCAALATGAWAQEPRALPEPDSVRVLRVQLRDGTEFQGRIVAANDTAVTLVSTGGLRVELPRRLVATWEELRGRVVGGRFRQQDPNTSRLFFAPTGRTLSGGDGYFADYYLFFPFIAVGLTDRLMLAGGVSIFPGSSEQLVYVAPKLGVIRERNLSVAIGGIYATIPGEEGSVSAVYGGATFGNEDNALTLLGGMAFGDGESTPGFIAGFETRVSDGAKLIGEAWVFPEMEDLIVPIIIGPRFFGRKVAVDFGLAHFLGADMGGFPFVPWVDFVVNF